MSRGKRSTAYNRDMAREQDKTKRYRIHAFAFDRNLWLYLCRDWVHVSIAGISLELLHGGPRTDYQTPTVLASCVDRWRLFFRWMGFAVLTWPSCRMNANCLTLAASNDISDRSTLNE